ncbi:thrombopoietin isoform X4 [Gasterosteus aculeatus]
MEKEIVGLRADMPAWVQTLWTLLYSCRVLCCTQANGKIKRNCVNVSCVCLCVCVCVCLLQLQQKSAEVVEALRVFWDGVRVAKNQSTSECQTSLLEKLERHMANYVAIVSRLQMQSGAGTPPPSSPRSCSSVTSTSEVLKQYGNLLRGKLERLAADLRDKAPESRQRSTAAEGRCG